MRHMAWTFAAHVAQGDSVQTLSLVYATRFRYCRHVKVRVDVNPYSPKWESYLAERHAKQGADTLHGRTKLQRLWLAQDGLCPECNEPITQETGWHVHHIQHRAHGGGEQHSNLRMLHPNCHRQHHVIEKKRDAGSGQTGLIKA